uniref:YbcC family protein n=3 Tax=Roseivirga sp. TaxID=1964215 RepID=UPI004048D623
MTNLNKVKESISIKTAKNYSDISATLRKAAKKIAPLWPLENFVAVNPYLGLTDLNFKDAAEDLANHGGIQSTLPQSYYLEKIDAGIITKTDLSKALVQNRIKLDAEAFLEALKNDFNDAKSAKTSLTVADLATKVTNKDWDRFMTARISAWATSHFDTGQASWSSAKKNEKPFLAWKEEAEIDRTTDLSGLKGFRKMAKSLPDDPLEATLFAFEILGIPNNKKDMYLHSLLLRMSGWSGHAARLDWDNELNGGKDGILIEFLAVLICWEACLLGALDHMELQEQWKNTIKAPISKNMKNQSYLSHRLILQEAFDLAGQRNIIEKFTNPTPTNKRTKKQALAQAIFCIDVRSEVFRRNLEIVNSDIETLGFAGFFAFPIEYVPIGHEKGEANCPVLLTTGPTIIEELSDAKANQVAINSRIINHQITQVWKSFKAGAITCFSFVSPMGLSYLPKLFTDSFAITRPVPQPDKAGLSKQSSKNKRISLSSNSHHDRTVGIPIDQQIQMAKNALTAMSLTSDFAKYVMIVGHGSTSVNNPHATGLDCGACGGHSGEANAKVAAAVLNNVAVREALKKEGISIPDSTIFLACLHDTTTDEVSIFNEPDVADSQLLELSHLKQSLAKAGLAARTERSMRMSDKKYNDKDIIARSKDWSQIRPEWGLAGCNAFVVAPRERTQHLNFGGRSFLHSYKWEMDKNFSVLELIMTAPMVVTSWISLQYYASTVDNKHFGSGNKTLHNVTSGIGVLEGFTGDLRVGLPIQSVHDGEQYQHEPLKLNVIIEAPISAMNQILEKHHSVKNLCDNGWIYLLRLDENGKVSHKYVGNLSWEEID